MEIDIKNIKAAYRTATESERTLLYTLFPDLHLGENDTQADNRPVTERIKTFEDACRELGKDHPMVLAYHNTNLHDPEVAEENRDILVYMKLRIITAALNEGWQPQFTEDEWRWYPWFCLWTEDELSEKSDEWRQQHALCGFDDYQGECAGFAYASSDYAPSSAIASIGSRLCYQSEALADYSGRQFADLWADFLLIRK